MTTGAIVFYDACAIGLPLLLIAWLLRHRRDYAVKTDLTVRGNAIIKGVVEADTAPVTIDYEQTRVHLTRTSVGRPDAKAAYEWEEKNRTIKGTPFVLRTEDRRIQVDPDEDDVSLLWEPDHIERNKKYELSRVSRAILEPGATVEIFGNFRPAPAGGDPYREGATLPMLVPSRIDRLLISKRPIAPKFAAMRHYLAMRACATAALVGVFHVAYEPVWKADLAQVGLAEPSLDARRWIGVGLAAVAYYFWRAKRPWRDGACNQIEIVK